MADFKPIESQEEFEKIIMDRIHSAKNSVRKEYEGYLTPEQVEKKVGTLSKENLSKDETIQSLTKERDELKAQIEEKDKSIANYENDSVKRRVADELGLSFKAISYIQGTDEESIRESAKGLKDVVGKPTIPLAELGGTAPEPTPEQREEEAMKSMLREMRGE